MLNEFTEGEKGLIKRIKDLKGCEIVKTFTEGFSSAQVRLVWANYGDYYSLQVFKFGKRAEIERERENWDKYVKNSLDRKHIVHVKDYLYDKKGNALLIYDCASHQGNFKSFKEYYDELDNPAEIVEYLFEYVLNPWFATCRYELEDYTQIYRKMFDQAKINKIAKNMSLIPGTTEVDEIKIRKGI